MTLSANSQIASLIVSQDTLGYSPTKQTVVVKLTVRNGHEYASFIKWVIFKIQNEMKSSHTCKFT